MSFHSVVTLFAKFFNGLANDLIVESHSLPNVFFKKLIPELKAFFIVPHVPTELVESLLIDLLVDFTEESTDLPKIFFKNDKKRF